jgi:hypothetical protein
MFSKLSLSGFFSSDVSVFTTLIALFLLSWFSAFRPTLNLISEVKRQELAISQTLTISDDDKLLAGGMPFVLSIDSLSSRDDKLLTMFNKYKKEFGYEIARIEPHYFTTRSKATIFTTSITLEGDYKSFIKIVDRIVEMPELGKLASIKIYVKEERVTKKKTLLCDLSIQIISEL